MSAVRSIRFVITFGGILIFFANTAFANDTPDDPPPESPPESPGETIEVHGTALPPEAAERTAEAIHVVDTTTAKRQTADLGEVLARTEGVAVRRNAGLGSDARFSLDGLYDDQIRLFIDGVPLDLAGFPFGIVNVPVNLIDRVEIFRGVVPIRFGADALGGAVNLVTPNARGSHASASYQLGSFGTHRATASVSYDDPSGLYGRATGFFDRATNDYDVDVQTPDAEGHLRAVTVPRFHDGYVAGGGILELGVRDRAWADRLAIRGYFTGYDKDLQSNTVMTIPYGEVRYGERVGGASLSYAVALPGALRLDLLAAYAHRRITFHDESDYVYNWLGDRVLKRDTPGEINGSPYDSVFWQDAGFARALLARTLPLGELRLAITPELSARTGDDRRRTGAGRDPLSARLSRQSVVSGVEWELSALGDAIENIAFIKNYVFRAAYERIDTGGNFKQLSRHDVSFGGGDGVRWRARPWLYLKASYEYATRLPSNDELFGDGVLIGANLELSPETSHNVNLGPRIEYAAPRFGELAIDLDGFWRDSHKLMVLLGGERFMTYQNVYDARALGVDATVVWSSPHRWVTLDGSASYLDLRNASGGGTFGAYDGDRVPNRPYLFASFGARGQLELRAPTGPATIEPFYVGRYVGSFPRGWESLGLPAYQQVIAAQLAHGLGVTTTTTVGDTKLILTLEVDNLTNAKLFDSFGAQRPGRAYYAKLVFDL